MAVGAEVTLFPDPVAPPVEGIDLRLGDVADLVRDVRGARLIVADPPWQYNPGSASKGKAQPEENDIYDCMNDTAISAVLDAAHACSAPAARLAVWYTWPKAAEWIAAGWAGPKWGPMVTGGAWIKEQQVGVGHHWRGQTEPIAIFTRGSCGRASELLLNGYVSPPGEHSEKPVEWMRAWVRAWTKPGDLVLDLWSGMAPLARACLHEGRRYIGAEIDPERHARAMAKLHNYRSTYL